MKKNSIVLVFLALFFGISSYAAIDVFSHPSTSKNISSHMNRLRDVSCKFTQRKNINGTSLVSGGNFRFDSKKGAVFETTYPIKSTVAYGSGQNKQVNDIIIAVSNKNYAYLDRNFNLYFITMDNGNWTIGLKPKSNSVVHSQLRNIVIDGKRDINRIQISTVKNGTTDISFRCEPN